MTDHIEDCILALAEKAEKQLSEHSWGGDTDENGRRVGYECDHDDPCAYEELLDAMGGDQDPAKNRFAQLVVAACRTVAAARGRGVGSDASVSEELRGMAELLARDGFTEWSRHLSAKVDALDAALAALDEMGRKAE